MTSALASGPCPGPASVHIWRRIEWADTDGSGHWYHGTIFRLLEAAEAHLFAQLGLLELVAQRLPRVQTSATFLRVLRYYDHVECLLRVQRVGTTSIDLTFEVLRESEPSARAQIRAVLVDAPFGRSTPWPPDARQLLLNAGELIPDTN